MPGPRRALLLTLVGCTSRTPAAPAQAVADAPPPPVAAPPVDAPPPAVAAPPEPTIATWLAAHPEVLALTADTLDDRSDDGMPWTSLVTTAAATTRCLYTRERSWCWPAAGAELPDARVDHGDDEDSDDEHADDEHADEVLLRERLGKTARWLRFPRSEWTRAPAGKPAPAADTRPTWWPGERWIRPKTHTPAKTAKWQPLAAEPATLDLGPLRGLTIRPVPASTPALAVIELTQRGEDEDTRTLCARWQERWRCAPARTVDTFTTWDDQYDLAHLAGDQLVLQRSTLLNGGNGMLSGASGSAWLEWFAPEDALRPLAALHIGEMEWLNLRFREYGPYFRWVKRYYHSHAARGACVALTATEVEHCSADAGFNTTRRSKRQREMFNLWPVPDALPIVDGVATLPEPATRPPPPDDEMAAMDVPMPSWKLAGVWRWTPGALRRVSPDPAAACP